MNPPIVIVGAGFSGITSLKICLENGLEAVVYEKTDNFGGLWRFREDDEYGVASIQRTTVINSSKELNAFSDFPPPKEYANYMHNSKTLSYLAQYMEKFQLEQHIRYRHEILQVVKGEEYEVNGHWKVLIRNNAAGEEKWVVASAILVCIGHHVFPNRPDFPGLSEFQGLVKHSHSFKDAMDFDRKKAALVVGIGNSGLDAAVELSNTLSQVYLSTRRGAWIMNRLGRNGIPVDHNLSRLVQMLSDRFPDIVCTVMETRINEVFDHELYKLKPAHRFNGQHVTISDAIPSRIASGVVQVKGDVSHFTPTGVVFKGEENKEYEIGGVVLATGYNIKFPFLPGDLLKVENNCVDLYLRLLPPELEHPNLFVIGLIQPFGSIFPISEMQARYAAGLIKGEIKLPSVSERWEEIRKYQELLRKRFVATQRHTIQVDVIPYMDELASHIGCKPNLRAILFADPKLFFHLTVGPIVSYQYRLTGPHQWSGARDAILQVKERVKACFDTKYDPPAPPPQHAASKSLLNSWTTSVVQKVVALTSFGLFLVAMFISYAL